MSENTGGGEGVHDVKPAPIPMPLLEAVPVVGLR